MRFTKKGNLFQTFLLLIKKTSTPLVNPIGTCFIPCFFLFVPATDPKASVVIFAADVATFGLPSVDDPSFFLGEAITSSAVIVRVATVVVLDDGSGSRPG